jgi:hypothetical protein
MTRGTRPALRAVLVLTVLGLALAQTGVATTAPDPGRQGHRQPTLLWRIYPLAQHPTARDEVTIRRALRLLGPISTGQAARDSGRSAAAVFFLVIAAFLLGISALPQPAFPDRELSGFVVRWRTELVSAGAAAFVVAVLLIVLG